LNAEGLRAAVASLPGDKHTTTAVDVRDSKQVDAWINGAVKTLGKLDGAVNLAGVIRTLTNIVDETDENWEFIMGRF
jgi:arginine metabolism regulation protein II